MKTLVALGLAGLLGFSTLTATTQQAKAGDADVFIAGAAGLLAGAIIANSGNGGTVHVHHRRYGYYGPGLHHGPRHYGPRHYAPPQYGPHPRKIRWRRHVSWCYDRYRSYNHHTNTFVAYSGRVRECRSPFIGARW